MSLCESVSFDLRQPTSQRLTARKSRLPVPLPSATLLSGNLFPNQPTPDEDNSNHQAHKFDGRENNTRHRNELHKFGLPW